MNKEITLVVPTINRVIELESLLQSLCLSIFKNFDILIVDQNEDDRLSDILIRYEQLLSIQRLKSNIKGANKARNLGLNHTMTEFVCFPDDDCEFLPQTIGAALYELKNNHTISMISGKSIDRKGMNSNLKYWPKKRVRINENNSWITAIEYTMFFRTSILKEVKGFDDNIGPGSLSVFKSGESAELIMRLLKKDQILYFSPEIQIYHPDFLSYNINTDRSKVYGYSLGMGYVLKKHYSLNIKLKYLLRPLAAIFLSFVKLDFTNVFIYYLIFKGRLTGMMYKTFFF
jgi:glycosyltransferase involved in cell wall biosynthesis